MFQTPDTRKLDRKDHVCLRQGDRWKCCLCGAITRNPPHYKTDGN